jgi:hypothetical protein
MTLLALCAILIIFAIAGRHILEAAIWLIWLTLIALTTLIVAAVALAGGALGALIVAGSFIWRLATRL